MGVTVERVVAKKLWRDRKEPEYEAIIGSEIRRVAESDLREIAKSGGTGLQPTLASPPPETAASLPPHPVEDITPTNPKISVSVASVVRVP